MLRTIATTEVANLLLSRRSGLPALRSISLPLASLAQPVRETLGAAFALTDDDGTYRYEHGVE